MKPTTTTRRVAPASPGRIAGFTLVELMIAMTISLLLMGALVSVFVNTSRSSAELAKTNGMIDSGRFAAQLLQTDIEHGGYWGGYVPQFDDLTATVAPGDVPANVPNPCQPYANWDGNYVTALIGIPVQTYDTLPAGTGCLAPVAQRQYRRARGAARRGVPAGRRQLRSDRRRRAVFSVLFLRR